MALITRYPGGKPLGVITLEDVIESLIGEVKQIKSRYIRIDCDHCIGNCR